MATIFQKIFLPRNQWKIFDFIDKNRTKIEYKSSGNSYVTFHTFSVIDGHFSLHATHEKIKGHGGREPRNLTQFIYKCHKSESCTQSNCALKDDSFIGRSDNWQSKEHREFAYKVYNRMLKYYMNKNDNKKIKCK